MIIGTLFQFEYRSLERVLARLATGIVWFETMKPAVRAE
jgi:hypothetical protein